MSVSYCGVSQAGTPLLNKIRVAVELFSSPSVVLSVQGATSLPRLLPRSIHHLWPGGNIYRYCTYTTTFVRLSVYVSFRLLSKVSGKPATQITLLLPPPPGRRFIYFATCNPVNVRRPTTIYCIFINKSSAQENLGG